MNHNSVCWAAPGNASGSVNYGNWKWEVSKLVDFCKRWSYHGEGLLLTGLPSLVLNFYIQTSQLFDCMFQKAREGNSGMLRPWVNIFFKNIKGESLCYMSIFLFRRSTIILRRANKISMLTLCMCRHSQYCKYHLYYIGIEYESASFTVIYPSGNFPK